MTTLYALRHKATGLCMPQLGRRGHSHWEPQLDYHDNLKPRLFWSKRSAQNARTMWVNGPWKREAGTSVDWEGNHDSWDETVPVAPLRPRGKDDLELIVFALVELGDIDEQMFVLQHVKDLNTAMLFGNAPTV